MITVVIIKNPFEPWNGREVQNIEYHGSLGNLASLYDFGTPNKATLNGYSTDYDAEVKDGDFVVIYPEVAKGGKSILSIIAVVALSVVSMGAGAAVAGVSSLSAATGWAAIGGWLTAAGVMFIGNTLIGRYLGARPDMGRYDYENNPTYSWGDVQTMEGQNNSIAVTYGKVKSAGQTIGKYIHVENDKEYLNWLISAGEGPLEISEIKLNDNPVESYEGTILDVRPGSNNQPVINNFNDTYFTKALGYQLLESERIDTAQGNATEGLIVKVEFSNGLYYANDNGTLGNAWVDLAGYYKRKEETAWHDLISSNVKIIKNAFEARLISERPQDTPVGEYTISFDWENKLELIWPGGQVSTIENPASLPMEFEFGPFIFKKPRIYFGKYLGGTAKGEIVVEGDNKRVEAAQASAVRKEYRIDNLEPGEYEVKMMVSGRSSEVTSSRASTRCWWSAVTSIVYDDFQYPNIALIGLKSMATDQISGSPSLSFLKERKNVLVYEPYQKRYVERAADNPAWACYDMLHMCSRLDNPNEPEKDGYEYRGCRAELILYDQFKEWADFCNDKQLHVNIEINVAGELLDAINQNIANCGRGMVVRMGTKYGCVFDCVKQPTQMFGMGNIKAGTFHEEFLPTNDRANCVEVTYMDAKNNYSRQTITIYGEDYDESAEERIAQVTYNGITSYEQAYREGMYQLYCNKYQLRTVTFEADIDAIACTVGDVVLVAHDVPQWAYSGRIAAVEGQTLSLPVEIVNPNQTYRIMYRTINDNLYTSAVTVLSNKNGTCKVKVLTPFTVGDEPQQNDIFDLALIDVGSKPFIVKAITKAQDFTRKIECLEYQAALYEENYSIPPIDYSMESQKAKNVLGLDAMQAQYVQKDGSKRARLYASWEKPDNGGTFTIMISEDGEHYRLIHSNYKDTKLELDLAAQSEFWLKVITVLGVSQSSGVVIGPVPNGYDQKPPDVTDLETEVLADGTRRYYWNFEYPSPNDIAGFKFKYIQGNNPNWNNAYDVQEGLIISQPFESKTVRQGTHTIMVKAVDNAGQESENFAACLVDFGEPLRDNVISEIDYSENDWAKVNTNGFINKSDGFLHAKQTTMAYTNPHDFAYKNPGDEVYEQAYDPFYVHAGLKAAASGNFYILYDIDGPSNFTYRIRDKNKDFKQYSTKIKVKRGDTIEIHFETNGGANDTVLKKLIAVIDVPDRNEHFNNLTIPTNGLQLPIKTPNYVTTAVHIDSLQLVNGRPAYVNIITKNPCVIQITDDTGTPVETVADISWQGFERS